MEPLYVVVNIGCIECNVSSKIVGVFADPTKAQAVANACAKKYGWRERGENRFTVFELPAPETIDSEYDVPREDQQ